MSLSRTNTTVRLKSTDDLYYDVSLVDKSEAQDGSVVIPEADPLSGSAGTSDAYVALIGPDSQVYRWSLNTFTEIDPETGLPHTFVQHLITLSPDQFEANLPGLDLLFGSDWLRVKVDLQDTGDGTLIPNLIVVEGEPWPGASLVVVRGGIQLFARRSRRVARYS